MQKIFTTKWQEVVILSENEENIEKILLENRGLEKANNEELEKFFNPKISDLHNPFLMPDIREAIVRIVNAVKKWEKIVVFGDYDVDGVSSTAVVVKFLSEEMKAKVSYRIPHRSKDGYGLKEYFFDELAEKWVTLVVTVDCGTRDILPIAHAKKLWIDVVVTDHHAVPDIIPTEVIGILNPKRKDSNYPFSNLAGAGVAFKLIHGILLTLEKIDKNYEWKVEEILTKYIDIASLGTVADCMPLIDENRIITTLGLKQMKNSSSAGLKKYVAEIKNLEWNADIIGFQIWPRINASGRMDTPITALRWLLSGEDRCDEFLEELEKLNSERKNIVVDFVEKAIENINLENPILYFFDQNLEHGIIGLVAGRLTEKFNRVTFSLCEHHEADGSISYVASCRAPEWCNLMEILDDSKELFLRYGGHKQAAGFSVKPENLEALKEKTTKKFYEMYPQIPESTIKVEAKINPYNINLELLEKTEKFKPFWIWNPKPQWLFEDVTITEIRTIGTEAKHLKISIKENPLLPILFWNGAEEMENLKIWEKFSLIVDFEKNFFNQKETIQAILKYVCIKK